MIVGQELCGFRLPHDFAACILRHGFEERINDGVTSTFWEDEMLIRSEFEENVLLVCDMLAKGCATGTPLTMVVQLDAMV